MTQAVEPIAAADLRGTPGLASRFGVKAAQLCEFSWRCADLGHPVPATRLVPANVVDPWLAPVRREYPAMPELDTPPTGGVRAARRFAELAAPTFAGLPTGRFPLLRSSAVWPAGLPRPPGLDITVRAAADPAGALHRGVHRAYADLCRRRSGDPAVRFGLMLSEYVRSRWEGTAYRSTAGLCVELGVDGVEPVRCDAPAALATTGMLGRDAAGRLFAQLTELAGACPVDGVVEVEFLLDRTDRLLPTQRRLLRRGPASPAPFHSPTRYAGPLVDLRGVPRDTAALHRALRGSPGAALVVPVGTDAAGLDLFAVLWTLDRNPGLPAPGALMLTYGLRSSAGMATHLRWLASSLQPQVPVYCVSARSVPVGADRVTLDSDGVRLRCVW